jgi:hypothetical protein
MSNYNSQLQLNNTDLQTVLQTLQTKAAGGSGNTGVEDAFVTKTLTNYMNNRITYIGDYAFTSCSKLTVVSFPACASIGAYAFNSCNTLVTASFPMCTTIGMSAFNNCYKLTSASFPMCTSINSYAFSGCNNLKTVSFPACTKIGTYAFHGCNMIAASFPMCTTIGVSAFCGCYNLTTVNFPMCTNINSYAFHVCRNLTTGSFPMCTNIDNNAFNGCYNLKSLYLTGSSICKLSNSNAFNATPYAGYSASFSGTPYIYVPASLVTSYKTATNWVYFSKYFSAIEGEDEPGIDVPVGPGNPEISITVETISGETAGSIQSYSAETGMTWNEWINSEYNTDEFFNDGDYIFALGWFPIVYDLVNEEPVKGDDTIIANHYYYTD